MQLKFKSIAFITISVAFIILVAVIIILLLRLNSAPGEEHPNSKYFPEIEKEVKFKFHLLNPSKHIDISVTTNPDNEYNLTLDLLDSKKCDLRFLNRLSKKYPYEITIKGQELKVQVLTTPAIKKLTLINTGDADIIWPAQPFSIELQILTLQNLKSNAKEIKLPPCPNLKCIGLYFMDDTTFDLQELKKYPNLKYLFIGQQIVDGEVLKNRLTFTNRNKVNLDNLTDLWITGNSIGYYEFFKAANLKELIFFLAEVDMAEISKNASGISTLILRDCKVSNLAEAKKISTLERFVIDGKPQNLPIGQLDSK